MIVFRRKEKIYFLLLIFFQFYKEQYSLVQLSLPIFLHKVNRKFFFLNFNNFLILPSNLWSPVILNLISSLFLFQKKKIVSNQQHFCYGVLCGRLIFFADSGIVIIAVFLFLFFILFQKLQ